MPLDINNIRKQFPALNQTINGKNPIFLDGPGGTQVPKSVPAAMVNYLENSNSNLLNSPFFAVQDTHKTLAAARNSAAKFVNAPSPNNIIFGASMSAATAHLSRAISRDWQQGDEIIVTTLDHYSNVSFWQQAAADKGAKCHIVKANIKDCTLDYDHLESIACNKTKLIAFTLASNICGSYTDAKKVINIAKSVRALTYADSVHAAPHILPNVQELDCDFLACSAYKFYGPHLGFVYGKEEHLNGFTPYKVEPAPKEAPECWEMGTKSFEALAGLTAAIDYMCSFNPEHNTRKALETFYEDIFSYEQQLTKHFIEQAKSINGLKIYGITDQNKLHDRTPTFAFTITGHHPQYISDHLAEAGISTGSGNFYAKALIDSLGLAESGGIVRAGCLHYNTIDELDRLFEALKQIT